jgi:hypothetical protein
LFVLVENGPAVGRAAVALQTMLDMLGKAVPVRQFPIGAHTLLWAGAQERENLHRFTDGFLLGKLAVDEAHQLAAIDHDGPIPSTLPSIPASVLIRTGTDLVIEPVGVATVFTSGRSASDRQLLLAATLGMRPGPAGVAVVAGIGYFPGNLSLFDDIERIPFLHTWHAATASVRAVRSLALPKPDDGAMIDRLVSTVPQGGVHTIGLSGGLDSRFVLGVLVRAGADVKITRFTDEETPLVEEIARTLDLEITAAGAYYDEHDELDPLTFTLRTDALIWSGVIQHNRLARSLGPGELYHSGQFSDSINKNAFKTAWKEPDQRGPYWERLIDRGLLAAVPEEQPDLRQFSEKAETRAHIRQAVEFERSYVELTTKKQWANWVYYMNRGMRWAQAFYDDLTWEANHAFVLSDIDAQLLGIGTGFWDNFRNDRAKRLNQMMLPTVTTPYMGDEPVAPGRGLLGAAGKLEYEYIKRLRVRRTRLKHNAANEGPPVDLLPEREPAGWSDLFTRPMGDPVPGRGFGIRRAHLTVASVLTYLEAAAGTPAEPAPADAEGSSGAPGPTGA